MLTNLLPVAWELTFWAESLCSSARQCDETSGVDTPDANDRSTDNNDNIDDDTDSSTTSMSGL